MLWSIGSAKRDVNAVIARFVYKVFKSNVIRLVRIRKYQRLTLNAHPDLDKELDLLDMSAETPGATVKAGMIGTMCIECPFRLPGPWTARLAGNLFGSEVS